MPETKEMSAPGKGMHYTLWTLQWLMAALFLFAGGTKLFGPIAQMAAESHMSVGFLQFIGVVETLGGLGLVLPGLLSIMQGLAPLASAGLVIIMGGAVVTTLKIGPATNAIVPCVTGLILIFITYGRWKLAPHR